MIESFALDSQALHFIETALAGDVDDADFREYLGATKRYLLDPLARKVF